MTLAGRTRDRKHGERPKRRDSRNSSSPPSQGEGNRIWRGASSPSPRLPSGRLRPSELAIGPAEGGTRWTGYGEGRGGGAFPQAQTRGERSGEMRFWGSVCSGLALVAVFTLGIATS